MITLYMSTSSASSRKARAWLNKYHLSFKEKNVFKELSKEDVLHLLSLTENGTEDILSTRSQSFKQLKNKLNEDLSLSKMVALITQNPGLLKRPIIADDHRMQVGYNEEDIRQFLPRDIRKAEKRKMIKEKEIKKSKPLPSITDEEKPFDIPDSWEWVRLGNIAKRITDGTHNPPPNSHEGKQVISAINIKKGKIDFSLSNRFVSEDQFLKEDKRTNIRKGDVLLTIVGSLGNAAVVDTDKLFTAQRSVAVISSNILSKFLYYVLISAMFKTQIFANAKGTTQKGIYLSKLINLKLPLPPLAEQNRIVDKIDNLFIY